MKVYLFIIYHYHRHKTAEYEKAILRKRKSSNVKKKTSFEFCHIFPAFLTYLLKKKKVRVLSQMSFFLISGSNPLTKKFYADMNYPSGKFTA